VTGRAGSGGAPVLRRWVGTGLVAPVLALPVLVVGVSLAAPAAAGEVERLLQALVEPPPGDVPAVVRAFGRAAVRVAGRELPTDGPTQAAWLSQARLVQMAAIAAVAGLCYLTTLVARSRLQALLAAAWLAAAAPVVTTGHVLRPTSAAAAFGLVGLLCMQMVVAPTRRGGAASWSRTARQWGLCGCAAAATGLAIAAAPQAVHVLFLPGCVLTLAGLQLLLRSLRVVRRRGSRCVPVPSLNRRLWPWTVLTFLVPLAVLMFLPRTAPVVDAAAVVAPLLPGPGAWRWVTIAAVWVGAGFGAVRTGLRFGRGGRVGPDLVLLVYTAAWLVSSFAADLGTDLLPAAPALVIAASEGAAGLLFAVGVLAARRRRER
jgi:hypothetical protein